MNIRPTLVGLALLMAIVPAGAEDATLKDYTDTLLKSYGPYATVTNGIVEGQTKGGEAIGDLYPNMARESAAVASCGVRWTGGACPGSSTAVHVYCRNNRTVGGVTYEVQHDYYYYLLGQLRRSSTLLDCQATCTRGEMDQTTFSQLCP